MNELPPQDKVDIATLRQFEKDQDFLDSHLDQWRERYRLKWVAVYCENLVAVGNDNTDLLETLKEQGIKPQYTVIHKIGAPRTIQEAQAAD